MEKKKILIFNYFMYIGGAERALLGLLNAIDYTKYEVDLFLAMHVGEFMSMIPKEVNLLSENKMYAAYACPLKDALLSRAFPVGLARLIAKYKFNRYKKSKGLSYSDASFQYVVREMMPFLPKINPDKEYDLAISFIAPHNIVAERVRAKKKICLIHTDYTRIDINVEQELPVWNSYNHIISISYDVTMTFLQVFPSLNDKIIEIENILSSSFVREQAELISQSEIEKEMPCEENTIRLLSIGRFSYPKNFENIPEICRRINSQLSAVNSQLKVKWYIIGWGGDEALIRQKIAEAGVEDCVIILGKKTNPYPYIKACDIYCQPSRYEGKSVTVREAQMLYKPVVVTDYPTASSQIQNGVDGVIVPMDNEGCAKGLAEFIYNKALQDDIVTYLESHNYGNEMEVEKIYNLID